MFLDPRFPWLWLAIITSFVVSVTVYYGAIVSGWYKDPLMHRFRQYGQENPPCPVGRFLDMMGLSSMLLAIMFSGVSRSGILGSGKFMPLLMWMLMFVFWSGSLLVRRYPILSQSLPRWYFHLLQTSSRQERRFIGWAWLRIPRKMRWRLNGDQASFRVWADMVRITVIYGAREANDPWSRWQ